MSGLAVFATVIAIAFVAALAWLAGLFLRAPRGFQDSGGFGIDRRRNPDPNASAADRRTGPDNGQSRRRADDSAATEATRGTRQFDR
ncbi:hypothetical protein [Sphingomonas colocasiae]|uniref:Cbb3-type cytochrome oxidase assembly protein CcoS n=1 Tax=Sphingomonas colocasiae TaxID=1848973 RepID=A0ABS7PY52_9SPHN|nr:hypothetical protein [Sphingomonas colocasiae]MBY8826268.1 hypothetical protein [Sphingomonas colocasiae]